MAINSVSDSLMKTMNPSSSSSNASSVSDIQDRFMTLLVTQLKNQDPLNPMDNAQVTSQMAQLSTVSGISKMNTTLESLMSSFQSGQSLQATGMIGHSVLANGNNIALADGKGGTFGLDLASAADSVQISIRDSKGTLVRKLDLGALKEGVNSLEWDGKDEKGAAAPDGKYTYEVSATKGTVPVTATSLAVGAVTSVSTGTSGVKLNVNGLGAVNMADIRQIL